MQVYNESRRPSERTEQFLNEYLVNHRHLPGDRLPSTRQIAEELEVSESTVRAVVRKWLQEGRLRSRQGSGIFISREVQTEKSIVRLGGNVRNREQLEHWGTRIQMSILEAVLELGPKGSFASLYSATENIETLSVDEILARCQNLDGLIGFQGDPHLPEIAQYFQRQGRPFVYLGAPFDEMTANYVTGAYLTAFYRVASALRQCGRRRFLALVHPNVERSVSLRQKLAGIVNGLAPEIGRSVEFQVQICPDFRDEDGYRAIRQIWREGAYRPDAILCAGDELALGAFEALRELGVSVPAEVTLIAGAGADPRVGDREVATLLQPIREIGGALVSMLLEMIEKQDLSLPARILPVGFMPGATATEKESLALKKAFSA